MESSTEHRYNTNFTAGGLLHYEFIALEKVILSSHFEANIKAEESQNQFIGIKTIAARKRVITEVKRRVLQVPKSFWTQFYQWSEKEQKMALLYVCLKTYKLIFDIHWEVALKKFKTGSPLDAFGVAMYMDELASREEYISSWSSSTLKKINVQYRKALKDAGILKYKTLYKPAGIPTSFWSYFTNMDESWWLEACFITK